MLHLCQLYAKNVRRLFFLLPKVSLGVMRGTVYKIVGS